MTPLPTLDRRAFLGAAALAAAAPRLEALAPEPPFRISLAEWSLHRTLRAGKIGALDFPREAKRTFGIEAVEYVNQFFADKAADFAWLSELKRRAEGEGVKSLLVMIDGEGELADADDARRGRAVENHFKWIAAAKFLGCHSIRVNAGGGGTPEEQAARAADSLRRLCEMGETYGMNVVVENHGGLSSNGAWLAGVMKSVAHPRCGTLPDFGNFTIREGESYDRYEGVRELMPFAKAVSAKSYDFDADGNETTIDFPRMMRIVLDAGYGGHVGIEYEGSRLPEIEGIRATQRLLERIGKSHAAGR